MKPSKYQQKILDWLENGNGNATCNAVAGSGKTTTLKLAAQKLQSMGHQPKDIKVIVFGKQNSLDLIAKFGREWKYSIQTLHSVGFRILQQEIGKFRRDERVVSSKYRRIAEDRRLIPRRTKKRTYKGSLTESKAISRVEHFLTLIDLARLTLSDLSLKSITEIAYHHNLEGIQDFKRVTDAIATILIEGQEQAIDSHRIDFTDMVWLPVQWALNEKSWFKTYKWVLTDECQDLNAAQLELSLMLAGKNGRRLYVGDPRQCQPPGTQIRLSNGQTRAIEELQVGDTVVTYDRRSASFVKKGLVSEIAARSYQGWLYKVTTDGKSSQCTNSHRWLVRWTNKSFDVWVTYLMRQDDRYRVGQTKLFLNSRSDRAGNYDFGLSQRARQERADAAWVLKIHHSYSEALAYEQIVSAKFGLPQVIFRTFKAAKHYTQTVIDLIYQELYPQTESAIRCLEAHGRKLEYPIYDLKRRQKQGRSTLFETQACNLISDYMAIPVAPEEINLTNRCSIDNWQPITVESDYYSGKVYSLNVEKHHKYVADGLVTCNSIYGFAGADNRSYQKIVERTEATELPLSLCYRCPKSHIDLVHSIYPQIPIESTSDAAPGILECIEKTDLWDEEHPGRLVVGDMVLSRKTAPLVSLCIRLIGQGIAATVKGKDIGKQIKSELEAIADIIGFRYEEFNVFAEQYKEFKFQTYENLDNAEQLKENLADKLNALQTIYSSQPNATCVAHLCTYIDDLFSDDESPITLATVHRAKGLEGDRIFIIKPEDMPMTWESQLGWQEEQEDNLLYVALTRSKSELYIVGNPDWYKNDGDVRETLATPTETSDEDTGENSDELATSMETSVEEQETSTSLPSVNCLQLSKDEDKIDVSKVMLLISKLFSYEDKCELLTQLTDEVTREKWDRVFDCLLKDANRSDRAIATECKVSAPFVGKVRKDMIVRGEIEPEAKRVDRRGRKRKSPIN